VHRL